MREQLIGRSADLLEKVVRYVEFDLSDLQGSCPLAEEPRYLLGRDRQSRAVEGRAVRRAFVRDSSDLRGRDRRAGARELRAVTALIRIRTGERLSEPPAAVVAVNVREPEDLV